MCTLNELSCTTHVSLDSKNYDRAIECCFLELSYSKLGDRLRISLALLSQKNLTSQHSIFFPYSGVSMVLLPRFLKQYYEEHNFHVPRPAILS